MSVHTFQRPAARPPAGIKTRTLVVGYDGSDGARTAFAAALDRAGPGDRIVVVHALAPVSSWMGAPYYAHAVEQSQWLGRRLFDDLREDAEASAATVSFELHEGSPAEVLARIGTTRDADEIVVGSRGLGRLRGALGSVSHALLRDADRLVVVVPHAAAIPEGEETA